MTPNPKPGRVQITLTVEATDATQWSAPEAGADLVRMMVEAALKRITNDFEAGNVGARSFYYGADGVEVTWPVYPTDGEEKSG